MPTSTIPHDPAIVSVGFTNDMLELSLADGRVLSTPLAWFPRLRDATPQARANWRLVGRGEGLHWPEIDEDISVAGILGLPD